MSGLLHDSEFWVLVAVVIFIAATWKPAQRALIGSLDSRAERIRAELDEAGSLRTAAQSALADHQQRQRAATEEAQQIVSHAAAEAARLAERAARDLEAALARRRQLMRERIAQAEQRALAEIRATAVDIAIAAARQVIADGLDDEGRAGLVDAAIAQLPQQLR